MNSTNNDKTRGTNSDESLQKDLQFKVSSRCNYAQCVGVARSSNGDVVVQDTKNSSQKPLTFTAEEWKAFVAGVKNGEFEAESL